MTTGPNIIRADLVQGLPGGARVRAVVEIDLQQWDNLGGNLAVVTPWLPSTTYALNDRVINGGNAYVCTTAGDSAAAGGPTTNGADIVDGTVHWKYIGAAGITSAIPAAQASYLADAAQTERDATPA